MYSAPPNPFLDKLRSGRTAFGSFVFSSDPASTEILGAAGFDLAIIDMEHAGLTIQDVYAHGRAARAQRLSWWVRVGRVEQSEIGKLLDAGAQGVIFPHFGMDGLSKQDYPRMVRYPPEGTRPTCTGTRAADYGIPPFANYREGADRDMLAIGLVEDRDMIERIETLLPECGLDAVMPGGVGDLASSYGLHGQAKHPTIVSAVGRVIKAAKSAEVKVGVYLSDVESREAYVDMYPDFFIYSIDYKVLSAAYADILRKLIA